jgi:DSF synthase
MIQPTGPCATSILPSNYASEHVRVEYQEERKTIILTLCPQPRPCVTRAVLDGLHTASQWIRDINTKTPDTIRHMVLASDWDGVFSLGGDLDLFVSCIMSGDREQLLTYALDCVRVGHVFHTGFEGTLSTTSVIAGQALGGGLEGAACCQTIIAEKGSVLQLPEIKFGMFPGMGAISYLSRRSPGPHVRRMVETGAPLDVEEAYTIRMVDELTPKGHGLLTAHKVNAGLSQAFHGRMATRYALALAQGPSLQELESIARSWVDVAFKIDLRDMRLMNRLASSQLRLSGMQAVVAVEPQIVPAGGVFAFAAAS